MASSSKKRQTFAKLTRERQVKEKRERKREKKAAAAAAKAEEAAGVPALDDAVEDEQDPDQPA